MYPPSNSEVASKRKELAPEPLVAFKAFSRAVFADGALNAKTKQLIAVAVAHVTQCPFCIKGHTAAALNAEKWGYRAGDYGGHLGLSLIHI